MTSRWETLLASLRRIAFDSSALIYFLECQEPYASYVGYALARAEHGQAAAVVSTVVEMEILIKPLREARWDVLARAEMLLRQGSGLVVRPVDRGIARRAAEVRAMSRLAALDALIIATALEERCDAVIGNDSYVAKHFTSIPYLYLDQYVQ